MTFCDTSKSFPRNDVSETSSEIPYWWLVTTQIWVVLLIGWSSIQVCVVTHYQYGISPLISQSSFRMETVGGVAKCCLFSQTNVIEAIDFFLLRVLHVNPFFAAQKDGSGSLSEMKSLLERLSSSNYQLLKYLCKFLVNVCMNEGTMNSFKPLKIPSM